MILLFILIVPCFIFFSLLPSLFLPFFVPFRSPRPIIGKWLKPETDPDLMRLTPCMAYDTHARYYGLYFLFVVVVVSGQGPALSNAVPVLEVSQRNPETG